MGHCQAFPMGRRARISYMATWYERMRSAREKLGLSKTAFGKRVGVSQPTVTDWESGVMQPNGKNLLKASRVLGMTPEELMDGTVGAAPEDQPTAPGQEYVSVARVFIKASAGITGWTIEHIHGNGQPIFFRADWLSENGYKANKLYALKVTGASMEPGLHNGDLVVINTMDTEPKDGEVFVVNYEGEVVIKRMKRDAGQWFLSSDNADKTRYSDKLCDEHAQVVGRVIYKQSERI